MNLCAFLFVLLQLQTFEPPRLKQIGPVEHNLNVVGSTWVIADLDVGLDGRVRFATALKGKEPLRSVALSNVSRWRFEPARTAAPIGSHATAVFLFRPRDMFSAPATDLSGVSIRRLYRPPIPVSLSDPGYPVNSVAEGVVVLELRLSEVGSIQNMRVVKDLPGLTEFTKQSVLSWRFAPALWKGTPVPGTVIAVISYLRPVVL